MARAALVGRQELVVDLAEVRRLGDRGELALDDRGDLGGQRGELGLDYVTELDDPLVDLGVGAVESDGGVEALQSKQVFLCKERRELQMLVKEREIRRKKKKRTGWRRDV